MKEGNSQRGAALEMVLRDQRKLLKAYKENPILEITIELDQYGRIPVHCVIGLDHPIVKQFITLITKDELSV